MAGCGGCSLKSSTRNRDSKEFENASYYKLNSYDYSTDKTNTGLLGGGLVEVQFKNTRRGFFNNTHKLKLNIGDLVAVESGSGHDIGRVKLFHELASVHIKELAAEQNMEQYPVVYRKAKPADVERWTIAKNREKGLLKQSRLMAKELGLEMKISDVDMQGDNSKVIIYYIASGRVDFRELIKQYARKFNLKIEMKQIGARQEAGMVGGIGSCGRELCCSLWRNDFDTVNAQAARYQELPHNAQRLAGQCGKLKCCLMYELDTYIEAKEDFPDELFELETHNGIARKQKIDVLTKTVFYTVGDGKLPSELIPVPLKRVKEIINLNKRGIKVKKLLPEV